MCFKRFKFSLNHVHHLKTLRPLRFFVVILAIDLETLNEMGIKTNLGSYYIIVIIQEMNVLSNWLHVNVIQEGLFNIDPLLLLFKSMVWNGSLEGSNCSEEVHL